MLDSSRAGPLPRWAPLERRMVRWHFGPARYVPTRALEPDAAPSAPRLVAVERPAAVRGAVSRRGAAAAHSDRRPRRELGPHGRQGRHRAVLRRLHRPEPRRCSTTSCATTTSRRSEIVVTGWPQTDVLRATTARTSTRRSCGRTASILRGRSCSSWGTRRRTRRTRTASSSGSSSGGRSRRRGRFSLLFRPHPRDRAWNERFAAAIARPRACTSRRRATRTSRCSRRSSSTATCVVANAGTILLDGDRQRPPGRLRALRRGRTARRELGAEERRRRALPGARGLRAFYRAESFEEVVAGIERALERSRRAGRGASARRRARSSARSTVARRSESSAASWTSSLRERTARCRRLQLGVRVGVVACVSAPRASSGLEARRCRRGLRLPGRRERRGDVQRAHVSRDRVAAGRRAVMEDARLWMPEDASYRVVHGPGSDCERCGRAPCVTSSRALPAEARDGARDLRAGSSATAARLRRSGPVRGPLRLGQGFLFARRKT